MVARTMIKYIATFVTFVIIFVAIVATRPTSFTKIENGKKSLEVPKIFLTSGLSAFGVYVAFYVYEIKAKGNFSFSY